MDKQLGLLTHVKCGCRFFASLVFVGLLTSCSGDDSSSPPNAGVTENVTTGTTASRFNIEILNVQVDDAVSVEYTVTNADGNPVTGLTDHRYILAKLIPGANGRASQWQSYINRIKDETEQFPQSKPATQATNERDGTFIDNNDGSYRYIFASDVLNATDPLSGEKIPFEENLTHRLVIEIRASDNTPPYNVSYDFVPSGETIQLTRNIVAIENCNQCHQNLAFHGGNRVDTKYCVTCHNPGSTEPISNESLDFRTMIHKIHMGANLAGIKAQGDGANYTIYGFRNRAHTYAQNNSGIVSGVHYPQDIRQCTTCHVGIVDKANDDAILAKATDDGNNWQTFASIEACGGCHDNIAFNQQMLTDNPYMQVHQAAFEIGSEDCSTCHAVGQSAEVNQFHQQTVQQNKQTAQTISFTPTGIAFTDGLSPSIDITIEILNNKNKVKDLSEISAYLWADPLVLVNWDNGQGYQAAYDPFGDIAPTDAQVPLSECKSNDTTGEFVCSWNTSTLNNKEILSFGVLSVTLADTSVCIDSNTSALITCSDDNADIERVPSMVTNGFYDLTSLTESSTYQPKIGADINGCNQCHGELQVHMEETNTHAATDFTQCSSCHNATRVSFYTGRPGDLKFQVHKLHANNAFADGGHGVEGYPANLSNCDTCHQRSQINLPLQQNPRPSYTTTTGIFAPRVYTSPITVVCSSCHLRVSPGLISAQGQLLTQAGEPLLDNDGQPFALNDDEKNLIAHMLQIGNAVFGADNMAAAQNSETCSDCHALGDLVGVDVKHGLTPQ
ncbi:OmcA/MtrC family decaheme c-type cytochrome [Thalassotalea aquiviva]|uniref:OmcA/MtrC family decaheme c-type cytochrome n=1 Tax=Thalassotalea aquiviva TaxID=3242415 RepID=UPI00352B2120